MICVKAGTLQWAFDAGGMILGQPVVDPLGNIYFGAIDGKIYSIDSTGNLNWEYELQVPPSTSVMFLSGEVLCVGAVGKLFLISSDGELMDEIDVSLTPLAETIVGADGTLYVPSLDGVLHAFQGGCRRTAKGRFYPVRRQLSEHRSSRRRCGAGRPGGSHWPGA